MVVRIGVSLHLCDATVDGRPYHMNVIVQLWGATAISRKWVWDCIVVRKKTVAQLTVGLQ